MKKKILSILLAVVMMVTALPFNAFALSYGTAEENADRTIGLNFCGFATGATSYDGDGDGDVSDAEKLAEIEGVVKSGYTNQAFLPLNENLEETVKLYVDNNIDFWISLGRFSSSKETVEHYVNDAEYWLNRIRAAGGYDNFLGFWWDEPLWNGMTNDDMYDVTKALYEKWGKRNYIVEVPQVYVKNEGSEHIKNDENVEWLYDETLAYITDIGFDSYSWDVRTYEELEAAYGTNVADEYWDNQIGAMIEAQEKGTGHANFVEDLGVDYDASTGKYSTGRGFYMYYIDIMCKRIEDINKDMYVWFYPASYTTSTYNGHRADEKYCVAQFNFFKDQLLGLEDKYTYAKAGGLTLYSYASYNGNDGTKGTSDDAVGLNAKLPITVEGNILFDKMVGTKPYNDGTNGTWSTLAASYSAAKTEFDNAEFAALDTNVPFGSLDISDIGSTTINYNAVAGYEYAIALRGTAVADGATWETDGVFDGLTAETDYTITVRRQNTTTTKAFDVSTTAQYPYASGKGDTASYILKMPSSSRLPRISNDYGGWVGTTLSQGEDSTGDNTTWYKSTSSGKRLDGGYVPLVDVDGESYLKFVLDTNKYEYDDGTTQDYTNADGNMGVNLSVGDENRSSNDRGIDSTICADYKTSNLKYFAYRIRANEGSEGQVSIFDFYLHMSVNGSSYQKRSEWAKQFDIMYLEYGTNKLSRLDFEDGIKLTEQAYNGWVIIPIDAYTDIDGDPNTSNLQNIVENMTQYQVWFHNGSGCTHGAKESSWAGRNLLVGDVMLLEDVGAFVEAKQSANATTDNEKNILTVPVDNPITFNPSDYLVDYRNSNKDVYGYFWGITRYNNPNFMTHSSSTTVNGEQFFSYTVAENEYNYKEKLNADGTKAVADRWYTLFMPANYTLGVNFSANADNIAGYPSLGGDGKLYGEQTIATLYSDAASFNYVAFRLKTVGGKDGETSPLGIHIGTSVNTIDLTGTAVINYNDGTTTTIESGKTINVPSNFDGWIVVPSTSIASATRTGFVFLKDDNYSWYGKTLYHGDIKIVKTLDTFKKAHGVPEYDVNVTNTSLSIETDDADALFSLDNLSYMSAAELNADIAEAGVTTGTKYTIYAKYNDAVNAAVSTKSVYAVDDTALELLTVPDRTPDGAITEGGGVLKGGTKTSWGYWGLYSYPNSDKFAWMASTEIDGENFFTADMTKYFNNSTGTYGAQDLSFATAGAAKYGVAFIPVNYTMGVSANNSDANFKSVADLYPDVDFTNYDGVIVRLKVTGGDPSVTSKLRMNIGKGYAGYGGQEDDFLDVQLLDKTTGKVTTITTSGTTLNVPYNFDGWLYAPASALSSASIAELKTVTFRMDVESETSNWDNKIIYFGDMNIVEDINAFTQVHLIPDFEVTEGATSLSVSSTAIAGENVVYSLDKAEWLTAADFNATYGVDNALDYDAEYTVYAKYATAPADNIAAKVAYTAPYSTHKNEGAHYFLNVYDGVENYYMTRKSTLSPISWQASYALNKNSDGTAYLGDGNGGLFIRNFNGETFIEFDKNEVYPEGHSKAGQDRGCVNQGINADVITTGAEVTGIDSSIKKDNLSHVAIRVKISGDTGVSSAFSIYVQYPNDAGTSTIQHSEMDLSEAYLIDKATGAVSYPWANRTYGFEFTDEFDGWVVFPFTAYDRTDVTGKEDWLNKATNISVWLHDTGCHGVTSDWDNRVLYLGDITVLEGDEKFKMAHTKPDFELDADNTSITVTDEYEDGEVLYTVDEKTWLTRSEFNKINKRQSFVEYTVTAVFANAQDTSMRTVKTIYTMDYGTTVLDVPDEGGYVYSYDWGYTKGGLRNTAAQVLRNSTNTSFITGDWGYLFSETVDGENFFKIDFSGSRAIERTSWMQINFIPTQIHFGVANDKGTFGEYYDNVEDAEYMAIRIKMTGKDESFEEQTSKLSVVLRAVTTAEDGTKSLGSEAAIKQTNTLLVNKNDGSITTVGYQDSITMPENFDGWILVKEETIRKGSEGSTGTFSDVSVPCFYLYHNGTTSTSWNYRNLWVGDMTLVKDLETFKRAYFYPEFDVEAKGNALNVTNETDTAKSALYSVDGKEWLNIDAFNKVKRDYFTNYTVYAKYPNAQAKNIVSKNVWITDGSYKILEVPDTEMYLASNYNGTSKGTYMSQWHSGRILMKSGLADPTTGDDTRYASDGDGGLYVKAVNGETFLIYDPREMYNDDGTIKEPSHSPNFNNISSIEDSTRFGLTGIPSEVTTSDNTQVALRIKITGGEANQYSSFGFYKSGWQKTTSAVLIDAATGKEVTNHEWKTNQIGIIGEFDGWVVLPLADIETQLLSSTTFQIWFHTDACTHGDKSSNWVGKVLYLGDMTLIEDKNDFMSTIAAPAFSAELGEDGNKLAVTNEADTDKRALYSIDGVRWFDIDTIQTITLEDDYLYTVQAKYPWSDKISSTKVDTAREGVNAEEGSTALMPVDGDVIWHNNWNYNYGANGLGNSSSGSTLNYNKTGWTTSGASGYIYSTTLDDEMYWEVVDNPDITNCRQFALYPLYSTSTTVADKYENAEDFTHLALRLRLEEDGTGTAIEGATYPVSLNPQGIGASDGHYGKWKGTGVYFYDINTGEKTMVTVEQFQIPLGFDGYVIFPSNSVYTTDRVEGDNPSTDAVEEYYYTNAHYGSLSDMYRLHFFMHASGSHSTVTTADWTGTTLYVGDMLLLEDDDLFIEKRVCENDVHNLEDVAAESATTTTNGTVAHKRCTVCGKCFDAETGTNELETIVSEQAPVVFQKASLTLDNSTAVNFKANATALSTYTSVRAEFEFNGKTYTVAVPDGDRTDFVNEDMLVFTFDNIPAEMMGETITATLYATSGETEYSSSLEYSVKQYCYSKLDKYADDASEYAVAFKNVIVDLLYYGSAVQTYTGTNTDKLVKDDLTRDEKALASVQVPEMNGMRAIYNDVEAETVKWVSGNLSFQHNVQLKFKFKGAEAGYRFVISNDLEGTDIRDEQIIGEDNYNAKTGEYVVYSEKFTAAQMDDNIYVAVYNGDTKVSDTLAYSISAYARQKYTPNDPTNALSNVVLAMMRYGDAAEAFAPLNV